MGPMLKVHRQRSRGARWLRTGAICRAEAQWVILLLLALPLQGQSLDDAAHLLSARIRSAVAPKTAIALTTHNEQGALEVLQRELKGVGLSLVQSPDAAMNVVVTFSESLGGPVMVAQIQTGDGETVAIQPWVSGPAARAATIELARKAVIEMQEPILDFALTEDGALFTLSPLRVARFAKMGSSWMQEQQWPLSLARPVPRDLRGRIVVLQGRVQAFIPGSTCVIDNGASACTPVDQPFPVGSATARWVAGRNTMVLNPVSVGGDAAWVSSVCGAAKLAIASAQGDAGASDKLQAYDAQSGKMIATGNPLFVAGTVTALWPHDSQQVRLVTHNGSTDTYEASLLSVTCSR
jgi:hypothetical protein